MKPLKQTSIISNKPILITGSHRSGSTWVGKMIAKSTQVGYIHEPFNIYHRPGVCDAHFNYWFFYICRENESKYYSSISDTIHFKYKVLEELKALRSPRDTGRFIRDYLSFYYYRQKKLIPLVKDPIAVFSTEWLVEKFDMNVVILMRHPAAFAGSLIIKNWSHPFEHFLMQPLLMRTHLQKYKSEITHYTLEEQQPLDQAILLWRIIHSAILEYRKHHPDWIFIRHEDLSRGPIDGFKNIFKQLNLDWSKDIELAIEEHSNSRDSQGLMRDSKTNIWTWKERLSKDEIEKVYEQTSDIWHEFYSDEDW